MRLRARATTGLVGLCVACAISVGQPTAEEFAALWNASEGADLPQGIFLEYARWNRDGFKRGAGASASDSNSVVQFWYWNDRAWRVSRSTEESILNYGDSGAHPDERGSWALSDRQLRLNEESAGAREYRFDPAHTVGLQAYQWVRACYGLTGSGPLEFYPGTPQGTDERWTVRCESANGVRSFVAEGTTVRGSLLVGSLTYFDAGNPSPIVKQILGDWIPCEESPTGWFARKFERIDPEGASLEKIEFAAPKAVSRDEVLLVSATPPLDGDDPVRGEVTATSYVDNRTDSKETLAVVEGQWERIRGSHLNGRDGGAVFRFVGWVLLCCLVVSFIWYRFSRSKL